MDNLLASLSPIVMAAKLTKDWIVEGVDQATGEPVSVSVQAYDGEQAWDGVAARGVVVHRVNLAEPPIADYARPSTVWDSVRARLPPRAVLWAGLAASLLPILFPVWSVRWRDQPSMTSTMGQVSPAWLEYRGVTPRDHDEELRGVLFLGRAPESRTTLEAVPEGGHWLSYMIVWTPGNVHQELLFWRMVIEAAVVFAPFWLAATGLEKLASPTA